MLTLLQKMTALVISSCLGHTAVVQLLLKVPGVDVNHQDKVRLCLFCSDAAMAYTAVFTYSLVIIIATSLHHLQCHCKDTDAL